MDITFSAAMRNRLIASSKPNLSIFRFRINSPVATI